MSGAMGWESKTSSAAPAICPVAEGVDEGGLIDHVGVGAVDQERRGSHTCENLSIDHADGLRHCRDVDADEVRPGSGGVQVNHVDAGRRIGHVGVAAEHRHSERLTHFGESVAYGAHADDAQSAAGQLDSSEVDVAALRDVASCPDVT